jgi:hypothetical protein
LSWQELVLGDVTTGLTYVLTLILGLYGWILYRKSSHKLTSTMGLSVYFFTFAFYIFLVDHGFLFFDLMAPVILSTIGSYIWVVGILFFVYTVERDLKKVGRNPRPVTLITVIYVIIITITNVSVSFLMGYHYEPGIIFSGLPLVIIYIAYLYIDRVQDFEIARRSSPKRWFIFGVVISGIPNFFVAAGLNYPVFIVKNIAILIGAILLAYAWSKIPDVEELDWMLAIDRLMVIHSDSSIPLAEFKFRAHTSRKSGDIAVQSEIDETTGLGKDEPDQSLVAGALGGINSLIGEILTISGELNEISYGGKTILFDRRQKITSIMIAEKSSLEIRYRLDLFGINFEKEFYTKLEQFSGDIEPFSHIDDLVTRVFG